MFGLNRPATKAPGETPREINTADGQRQTRPATKSPGDRARQRLGKVIHADDGLSAQTLTNEPGRKCPHSNAPLESTAQIVVPQREYARSRRSPEPASLSLPALGGVVAVRRRRKD